MEARGLRRQERQERGGGEVGEGGGYMAVSWRREIAVDVA